MLSIPTTRPLAALLLLLCGAHWPPARLQAAAPADAGLQQSKAKFEILLAAGLYTRWPAGSLERPEEGLGVLKVAIGGSEPHAEQLENLALGRQISGRQVVVRHYQNVAEVEPCQILYLADSLPRNDRLALIEKYKTSPILLAGATPGFCLEGGGLNFQVENGDVKFALNPQVLANQKLVVDPRFSRLVRPAKISAPRNALPPAGQVHQSGPMQPQSGGKRP